ncbi:MAG: TetR family transcriptional regulator [Chloroflexota bacterium]
MPALWTDSIDSHRHEVREAILNAAAAQVAEQGLLSVTMAQIAEATGIGRATLYKYFPDVEAILSAWHDREIGHHLQHLITLRDQRGTIAQRIEAVLAAYAMGSYQSRRHRETELGAFLHRGERIADPARRLADLVRDLLAEGAKSGVIRTDVASADLASYCLHALAAARDVSSRAAVQKLVAVTVAGLRPAHRSRKGAP